MHSITSSEFKSPHLQPLYDWFVEEWGEVDGFAAQKDGLILPAPLLALDGMRLCGGLSFTRYKNPEDETIALWINAVLVTPAHRGKGVASDLILAAGQAAL